MSSASVATESLLPPDMLRQLERLELVSRKIFQGRMKGERRSPRKGRSIEFADYRNYVAGDDLRFIDWNTYARLEKLFLKMFMEEEDLHFYALVDTSRSMDFGEPNKLTYAKQLAAALSYIALVRADRVRVETLAQAPHARTPTLRGRRNLPRLLDQVNGITVSETTDLAQGVKNFALRSSGKGIVMLISDLLDKQGYEPALKYLSAQQMDVYVIHVLAPEEIEPQIEGDLALVDCEDADVAEITASAPLLERYRKTVATFLESARDYCTRRGISYIFARSDLPVQKLVANYLRERGLVR